MSHQRPLLIVLACTVGLTLLAPGCAGVTKTGQPSTTGGAPAVASEGIDYIDFNPWVIKSGGSATITIGGAAKRKASVTLTGVDGQAVGKTLTIELRAQSAGVYTAAVTAGKDMPAGKYRIEAVLTGATPGAQVKLTSSRGLTVTTAPPPA
jgi:hypothetical protein